MSASIENETDKGSSALLFLPTYLVPGSHPSAEARRERKVPRLGSLTGSSLLFPAAPAQAGATYQQGRGGEGGDQPVRVCVHLRFCFEGPHCQIHPPAGAPDGGEPC